jgi:membrane protein implicated in regulation of membrane protease activity
LLAIFSVIFDLLENSATSLVLLRYPAETTVLATLAPLFTLVKWTFVGASFAALIFLLGVLGYRRIAQRT